MSTVCGRPQGGRGFPAHVDRGGQKRDFFVDVINVWPLIITTIGSHPSSPLQPVFRYGTRSLWVHLQNGESEKKCCFCAGISFPLYHIFSY